MNVYRIRAYVDRDPPVENVIRQTYRNLLGRFVLSGSDAGFDELPKVGMTASLGSWFEWEGPVEQHPVRVPLRNDDEDFYAEGFYEDWEVRMDTYVLVDTKGFIRYVFQPGEKIEILNKKQIAMRLAGWSLDLFGASEEEED